MTSIPSSEPSQYFDARALNSASNVTAGLANEKSAVAEKNATSSKKAVKKVHFDPKLDAAPAPKQRSIPHQPAPMFLSAAEIQAAKLRAYGERMYVRDQRKNALIKDGLSYLLAAATVTGSGGLAALTQPLLRLGLNMIQRSVGQFRDGTGNTFARLGLALGGALGSLGNDINVVFNNIKHALQNPSKTFKKSFLDGTLAPKTWGHIGALVGGVLGGMMGGPIMAGAGFLAGRYAGQALGRLVSYATGNTGLTFGETLRQAAFAGFSPLTPTEVDAKIIEIDSKREAIIKALSALKPGENLTDPQLEKDRQRLIQLADTLENNYDMHVPLEDHASRPVSVKDDRIEHGVVASLTVSEYCNMLRIEMMAPSELQAEEMAKLEAAGIAVSDSSLNGSEKQTQAQTPATATVKEKAADSRPEAPPSPTSTQEAPGESIPHQSDQPEEKAA